ncbi:GNAT family N-acetyltransferase [Evansella sp. AB-rgal1]|uniref:GNAT family N-acetyltransferase n=1 Tax=Evansella sp. AB-rgal1 TaxID=3242696 RepID=UPI00359DA992
MDAVIVTTKEQLEDAYTVRRTVFIEEQGVPEEIEIDSHEKDSIHFVVYDGDLAVGAGRLRFVDGYGKAERVCVMKEYRKKGVGYLLMKKMEEKALGEGKHELKLNAQTHAEAFYNRIGYETVSDLFYDAGIPHVAMKKELN